MIDLKELPEIEQKAIELLLSRRDPPHALQYAEFARAIGHRVPRPDKVIGRLEAKGLIRLEIRPTKVLRPGDEGELFAVATGQAIEAWRQRLERRNIRRWASRIMVGLTVLAAIAGIVDAITGVIGVVPGVRERLFHEPSPTPALIETIISIDPAKPDEVLALVADFKGSGELDIGNRIWSRLAEELDPTKLPKVRIEKLPATIDSGSDARRIGERLGATIVIWGFYDGMGSEARFETLRAHEKIKVATQERMSSEEAVSVREAVSEPSSRSAIYFREELPSEMTYFASFVIGQLYYWDEQYDEALSSFTTAIRNAKGSTTLRGLDAVYFYRGYIYGLKQGKRKEAISDYSKAIELNPEFVEAYNNRGNSYSDLEQYDKALADYNKAIELRPNFASAYNNRGNVYRNLGELDKAVNDYNIAIDLDPDEANSYSNRGLAYYELRDFDRAIDDYSKAIELDPTHAASYNNRGVAYVDTERYEEALEDLNVAIELDNRLAIAYNNRGVVYYRLQKHDRALRDFNRALEIESNLVKAYYNRGLTNLAKEAYYAAIEDLTKALELDPVFHEAHNPRGVAYKALDLLNEALTDFSKAITTIPEDPIPYANRGETYLAQKKFNLAIADFTQSLVLEHPEPAKVFFLRGIAYWRAEEFSQALSDLKDAIDADPVLTEAYFHRGEVHFQLKDFQSAVESYSLAIELDESLALAYLKRGLAYHKLKQFDKAAPDLKRYLELEPETSNRQAIEALLEEME